MGKAPEVNSTTSNTSNSTEFPLSNYTSAPGLNNTNNNTTSAINVTNHLAHNLTNTSAPGLNNNNNNTTSAINVTNHLTHNLTNNSATDYVNFKTDAASATFEHQAFAFYVCFGVIVPIIVVFGMVGNGITAYVLWKKEYRTSMTIFLKSLVLTDTGILLYAVLILTPLSHAYYKPSRRIIIYKQTIYPFLEAGITFIFDVIRITNVWTIVSIAVERYVSICHPFYARIIVTKLRCKIITIITICVSIISSIPRLFASKVVHCQPGDFRYTKYESVGCFKTVPTHFGLSDFYEEYRLAEVLVLYCVLPMAIIIVSNLFIMKELMRMKILRCRSEGESREEDLCVILSMIIIIFIISQTPVAMFKYMYEVKYESTSVDYHTHRLAPDILLVFNSSINCVIYTVFGKGFRRRIIKVYRRFTGSIVQQSAYFTSISVGRTLLEGSNPSVRHYMISSESYLQRHADERKSGVSQTDDTTARKQSISRVSQQAQRVRDNIAKQAQLYCLDDLKSRRESYNIMSPGNFKAWVTQFQPISNTMPDRIRSQETIGSIHQSNDNLKRQNL